MKIATSFLTRYKENQRRERPTTNVLLQRDDFVPLVSHNLLKLFFLSTFFALLAGASLLVSVALSASGLA